MKESPIVFDAKILLFGEYMLMSGSQALVLPFPQYSGSLAFQGKKSITGLQSNNEIKKFYEFLLKYRNRFPHGLELDLEGLKKDIDTGLYLDSNIPQGYGAGSSGVLVASVYSSYAFQPILSQQQKEIFRLKNYFSFMESFFHGRSSGIDPLCSYLNRPLLVSSPEKTEIVEFPSLHNNQRMDIFLIDTGFSSQTSGLVEAYLGKIKNEEFWNILNSSLIPRNNKCIEYILNGRHDEFMNEAHALSDLQLEHFSEMIPFKFQKVWREGLTNRNYSLKLCGSGGGGFLLGFTSEYETTEKLFRGNIRKFLPLFKSS